MEIHPRDVLHGIQAPLYGLAQFIMPHRFPGKKNIPSQIKCSQPRHSDLSLSLYQSVLTGNSFRSTRTTFKSQFATQPRFRSPPFELKKCTMSLLFGGGPTLRSLKLPWSKHIQRLSRFLQGGLAFHLPPPRIHVSAHGVTQSFHLRS